MSYSEEEKDQVLGFYNNLIAEYGIDAPEALAWNDTNSQTKRLDVLLGIGDFSHKSVLDVGCGTGDLIPMLEARHQDVTYKGIDISPEFIEVAQKRHAAYNFSVSDFEHAGEKSFDYILASGVLSYKIPNYKERYFELVKEMFNAAKIGIGFNMLNEAHHSHDDPFGTYAVPEVYDFCLSLTDKLVLRQDYLPQDFTFYLYH